MVKERILMSGENKQENNTQIKDNLVNGSVKEFIVGLCLIIVSTVCFGLNFNTGVNFGLSLIQALGFGLCSKYVGGYIAWKSGLNRENSEAYGATAAVLIVLSFFWFYVQRIPLNDSFSSLRAVVKINDMEKDPSEFIITKKHEMNEGRISVGRYSSYTGTPSSELCLDLNIDQSPSYETLDANLHFYSDEITKEKKFPYSFSVKDIYKKGGSITRYLPYNKMVTANVKVSVGTPSTNLSLDLYCKLTSNISTHTIQPFTATFSILLIDSYWRSSYTNKMFSILRTGNFGSVLPICPLTDNFSILCEQISHINPKIVLMHYHCFRNISKNRPDFNLTDNRKAQKKAIEGINEIMTRNENNRTSFIFYSQSANSQETVRNRINKVLNNNKIASKLAKRTYFLHLPNRNFSEGPEKEDLLQSLKRIVKAINQPTLIEESLK